MGDLVNFLILSSQKKGKSFELAGPYVKSFDQIYDVILKAKNRKRIYFPLPFLLAKPIAFLSKVFTRAYNYLRSIKAPNS